MSSLIESLKSLAHVTYLVLQCVGGICAVAGEISDRQGSRVPASSPSVQTGWRSAMIQSVWKDRITTVTLLYYYIYISYDTE